MKSFRQFISEALETMASTQAKQMGLRGNGHGDYYDSEGKLVAKTIGGKLNIFKGRNPKDDDGGANKAKKAPSVKAPPKKAPLPQQQPAPESDNSGKGVTVVFGKFNPPAKSHEQLLKFGLARSNDVGFDYRVYPSRIQDYGSNPLNPTLKIKYMQAMFPDYVDYIVDSEDMKSIFDVLSSVYNDGYSNVRIVVGADRLGEFQSLAHRSQGQGYEFDNIEVMSAGIRDPDSDNAGPGSSAALKKAASENDFQRFASNLPTRMKPKEKEEMFNSVIKSMKLGEHCETWRVNPELDMEGLRVNYKNNKVYPVGALVENINTGVSGRVLRRGTNYLICVTNEGVMFKSWLQNVREATYEVGTDKYRKSLQKISAGQPVVPFTGISIKETMPKNLNKIRRELQKRK